MIRPDQRPCPARAAARPARAGTVLVLFALFLFVAMGIGALVVDLGVARLTQRQMQSAADGVALEIMRERDLARDPLTAQDDALRDMRRRLRANRIASWQYTEHLITGNEGQTDGIHGPGAFVDYGPGFGNLDAGALMRGVGFDAPRLAPNYNFDGGSAVALNEAYGDVVSGEFHGNDDADSDGLPDGIYGVDGNPIHLEDNKYNRVDFNPSAPSEAPYGDSVVVRLRRTRPAPDSAAGELNQESQPGVSSAGNTIEWMFGRGTTMAGAPQAEQAYKPREVGIKVRATSVAHTGRVVRANAPLGQYDQGVFRDGYDIGVAPFALHDDFWHFPAFGVWQPEPGMDGVLSARIYFEAGLLYVFDGLVAGLLQPPQTTRVGDRVQVVDGDPSGQTWADEKNWVVQEAYAPVFETGAWNPTGGFRRRVIGFVRVRAELTMIEDPNDPGEMIRAMKVFKLANELTPAEPWIAPRNASAIFDGEQVGATALAFDTHDNGEPWTWRHIMDSLQTLDRAVHAPVIVR